MNKLHPAVALAAAFVGAFGAMMLVRKLLTGEPEAPKRITSDIPATPVATAQPVVDQAPATSGTADGGAKAEA